MIRGWAANWTWPRPLEVSYFGGRVRSLNPDSETLGYKACLGMRQKQGNREPERDRQRGQKHESMWERSIHTLRDRRIYTER